MGEHRFAYALMPHAGGWQDGGVVAAARAFNAPLRWGARRGGGAVGGGRGRARPGARHGQARRGLRRAGPAALRGARRARPRARAARPPFAAARRSNLLEDDLGPAEVDGDAIIVDFRPWQIVTLLVT